NGGFTSRKSPWKKTALGIFRSAYLIEARKVRARWEVKLTPKGKLLSTAYQAAVNGEASPLVYAFKSACWYMLEGISSQQALACRFYQGVLESISSSSDIADFMDDHGIVGGRIVSLIGRIAENWRIPTDNVMKMFQDLSKIPEFIQIEGDRQNMQRDSFVTIYPLKLQASFKKGLGSG
ncbi:MAG: hypothetical protein ACFFBD_16670, partial [Candidatus Hodarchaeota archaeon]